MSPPWKQRFGNMVLNGFRGKNGKKVIGPAGAAEITIGDVGGFVTAALAKNPATMISKSARIGTAGVATSTLRGERFATGNLADVHDLAMNSHHRQSGGNVIEWPRAVRDVCAAVQFVHHSPDLNRVAVALMQSMLSVLGASQPRFVRVALAVLAPLAILAK